MKLTKDAPGIQVRRQELAITFQTCFGREATHVCDLHQSLEEVPQTLAFRHLRVDVDLVLPFELGPHGPELSLAAIGGLDVVHNIDVNVV